jgi:predicted amidohydrolase
MMKLAAIQLNAQDNVAENLASAEQWLDVAVAAGATLLVLPEGFAYLGPEEEKARHAERLEDAGPIVLALRRWARTRSVHVIAGGLPEDAGQGRAPFNTSVLFGPDGSVTAYYRKMHLFDVDLADGTRLCESKGTSRGMEPSVAEVDGVGVGLSICYDLRFPEHFAWQRAQGAKILTLPAAFTHTTGQAHWHVLIRARALETQSYVIAAAQEGQHPRGRRTFGHSMIVDPWGRVVSEVTHPGPGLAVADFDEALVDDVRARMPVCAHRHEYYSTKMP